jgi:hypothetical protein
MENFARSKDRFAIIQETADRRDLTPVVIEKDFWVCWTLRRLMEQADLGPHLTFKGGTSLSKAYGIIRRFSEDIDLTIGRTAPFVRDAASPMEADISNKEVKRRTEVLVEAAKRYVAECVVPQLQAGIAAALGAEEGWQVVLDDADPQTVLFHYPRLANYGQGYGRGGYGVGAYGEGEIGYIKPSIKLEFGARGEIEPHETRTVMPYVAEEFPDILKDAITQFSTLAAERTFWEKATLIHALHNSGKIRDRLSRHYYDLHMLAGAGVADAAIGQPGLLEQVVRNKSLMFRDPKASYETATFGGLMLMPTGNAVDDLKKDYGAMTEMFMGDAPSFESILQTLNDLQTQINGQQ